MLISVSPSAFPASCSARRLRLAALMLGFAGLAFCLMWWRWGAAAADSQAYLDTARFLRGDIGLAELRAPFAYRLLVPALAAAMPGELSNAFAALDWMFVSGAACLMLLTVRRLGFGDARAAGAALLLILALPTYWYAPAPLVDAGSLFARALFVFAVVSGQPWLAALAGVAGSAVAEENILLLAWLVATRHIALRAGMLALAAAAASMAAARWWLAGLPPAAAHRALADWRALAGSAGLVLPLALAGLRGAPAWMRSLKGLLLLMALPLLYAAFGPGIDARAIWTLYPMLIPFAAAVGTGARGKAAPGGRR